MKELLHQYKEEGKTVLMTTSTHMRIEEDTLVDPTYEEIQEEIKNKGYAFAGNRFDEFKIKALDHNLLGQLHLDPEKIVDGALIQQFVRYYLKSYPDAVIEVKQPEGLYQRALASLIEHNVDVTCIQKEWFMPQPKLVLLGAGLVSQYVEKTAHLLDFYTIVIDNREEFANKNIFTEAQEVHCVNYEEAEQYFPLIKKHST